MRNFLRGYDIDGVLTKNIKPKKPYVIISGRIINEWDKTIEQVGVDAPIYLRPYGKYGDVILAGIWKSEIISRFNIVEFYEDDKRQAEIIKKYCPNCKVILI